MRKGGIARQDRPGQPGARKVSAGIGIRDGVDLVGSGGRTEGRVELRQREHDLIAIGPRGHDVLVEDTGITRINQREERRASVSVAIDGFGYRADVLRVGALEFV
jgi:hypothetical protein